MAAAYQSVGERKAWRTSISVAEIISLEDRNRLMPPPFFREKKRNIDTCSEKTAVSSVYKMSNTHLPVSSVVTLCSGKRNYLPLQVAASTSLSFSVARKRTSKAKTFLPSSSSNRLFSLTRRQGELVYAPFHEPILNTPAPKSVGHYS